MTAPITPLRVPFLDLKAVNARDREALIEELAAYARFHFAAEESMMAAQGIDSRHLASQEREHANFVDEITRISQTAVTPELSSSLLNFLIHWLAYHILGSDQSMAR